VTVVGTNFVDASMHCRFGTLTAPVLAASVPSSTLLVCVTPAASSGTAVSTTVTLEVSANNQVYSSSYVVYTYHADAAVTELLQNAGPVTGGSVVRVFGAGFFFTDTFIACRFGAVATVFGSYRSATEVQCVAPVAASPQFVDVEVTLNSQDFTTSAVQYTYFDVVRVAALLPAVGPRYGGTLVTVSGQGFVVTQATIKCRFGTLVPSYATRVTDTQLLCASPATTRAATMAVEVAVDGVSFTVDAVTFAYVEPWTVDRLVPNMNPGTGLVTVHGANYVVVPGAAALCKFNTTTTTEEAAKSASRLLSGSVTAPDSNAGASGATWAYTAATVLSSTALQCFSPGALADAVLLEVTCNARDYSFDDVRLFYFRMPAVV
jgi:hypothetical protein